MTAAVATDLIDLTDRPPRPHLHAVTTEPLLERSARVGRVPRAGAAAVKAALPVLLRTLEGGSLEIVDGDRRRVVESRRSDRYGRPDLHVTIEVLDPRAYTALLHGSSGLGEAYRRGWYTTDDLTSLLRLLARAVRTAEPLRDRLHRVARPVAEPIRRRRSPDAERDRADIGAHYDLGNEFFALFLDETMTYSAGIFADPDVTMAEASTEKLDRVCRVLDLRPGQRILEIGTGWGSFALHAATHYGVQVVTTTLSAAQHQVAIERVRDAGLADRVEVRLDHYRELTGTYDAVVAIEMVEAVDWRELDDFIGACGDLLAADGALALQAIVAPPDRHSRALVTTDFIKSHVFPGGNLPSVGSIVASAGRRTDLAPVDLFDFGPDYAETLRRWGAALDERRADARALGLDDEFLRLWDFYLAYCEAGFEERLVSVVQLALARPGFTTSVGGVSVGV